LKGNCDANTYLTVKIGVGVDHANDADTTNAQYSIDASDNVGSTRTWEIRSANGTAATSFQTTTKGCNDISSGLGLKCIHLPAVSVQFFVGTTTFSATKTTNVPSSGGTLSSNLFQASIKTNQAASKKLYVYGLAAIGQNADVNDS
jgi:hypothetical protein